MQVLKSISEGNRFKRAVAIAIILCSILVGIETFYQQHLAVFQGLDYFFTVFFILEIIIRIGAEAGVAHLDAHPAVAVEDAGGADRDHAREIDAAAVGHAAGVAAGRLRQRLQHLGGRGDF
jgi:hypothetical protein